MKLYFTCPKAQTDFASDDYSLHEGYRVIEDQHGEKKLMGIVSLNSGCPICGQKHWYEVKDVMCPISRGENEE